MSPYGLVASQLILFGEFRPVRDLISKQNKVAGTCGMTPAVLWPPYLHAHTCKTTHTYVRAYMHTYISGHMHSCNHTHTHTPGLLAATKGCYKDMLPRKCSPDSPHSKWKQQALRSSPHSSIWRQRLQQIQLG